ncbi:hypothetical protein EUBSIR_01899 [[Eubacterium] siraeum DSM 15702]|uniref:Uncharacterized protein n=1 Tax=[Eubacterium] siraeum DSM 15702 TaxID=428128 RepID=B0MPU6_9FIRM|nr:hypothetical protein EUBSIR_01899 [[Eubacterium] siraeum DSM 15702]
MISTKNIGKMISIHALVKRATKGGWVYVAEGKISIHALVKRATAPITVSVSLTVYFNPRPREEGDIAVNIVVTIFSIFQSTPS